MGYKAEKDRIESKIKIAKRITLCVVLAIVLALCIFSAFVPASTWKYYVGKPKISKLEAGEMRIHFLDVGQGDSTLIEFPDGKVMLVDGGNGENQTATKLMRYLNALSIKTIDYLVVSHADSDHCGGLDVVVKNKRILNAYLPNVVASVNKEYAELYSALLKEKCARVFSSRETNLSVTEGYPYQLSFLYPYSESLEAEAEKEEDNNASSSVIWLDYQGVSALLTGDAPLETETLLMRDDKLGLFKNRDVDLTSTEILKVAHHGSASSTGAEFLQYLNVTTAVISCGKNNEYRHPSEATLTRLQQKNVNVYRTDEQGNILVSVKKSGEMTVKKIKN